MPINVTHANMNIDEYLSTHTISIIHTNTYKYRPLHTIHTYIHKYIPVNTY